MRPGSPSPAAGQNASDGQVAGTVGVQVADDGQSAATPATVAGSPLCTPAGVRRPLAPTDQPRSSPASASIAYRKAPSAVRPSSRSPVLPSWASPAAASSSTSAPSLRSAQRETAPSAKFVVNA